jgi:hypothetical protein
VRETRAIQYRFELDANLEQRDADVAVLALPNVRHTPRPEPMREASAEAA